MRGVSLEARLGGERFPIRIEGDEGLSALLQRALGAGPARKARGPAPVVLRWDGKRGILRRRGRRLFGGADPRELCVWAEWAATCEALERLRGKSLVLHAALLAHGRRGVIVAGEPGAGKTSLALALSLRHGFSVLADDVALVAPSGKVLAIERPVRLKPGVLRAVPEAARLVRRSAAGLVAPRRRGPPAIRGIVLLDRRRTPAMTVDLLDKGMAVARLSRLAWNFHDRPDRALAALARLAKRIPVVEVKGGSIEMRCAVVRGLLLGRVNP